MPSQPFSMRTNVLSGLLSVIIAAALGALIHPQATAKKTPAQPRNEIAKSGSISSDYVDPSVCARCHAKIAESYGKTGMGRSFSQVGADEAMVADFKGQAVENQSSATRYVMLERDGKLFERRSQIGYHGEETNIVEERVDYVIGSGNHARTFLHRDAQDRLIELPVSWYAEGSGDWAMSPGFDRGDQEDFRRAIAAECLFCHNAYPDRIGRFNPAELDPPAFPQRLPQGIDCQRCHGPGRAHVAAVLARAPIEVIQKAIVNPAKLDRDRQLEVCMQCHLETSSSHMPNEIRRFDRKIFSFRPGEPLGDYKLYLDPLSNRRDDRFEIAHAAYRLRMSACFRKSRLTCLTCHDPHVSYHGAGTTEHYVAICTGCHQSVKHAGPLPQTSTCLDCHMPKRRTDDVIHVVMTDHYIQRVKPDRDLLGPLKDTETNPNAKAGIALYYPPELPLGGESELYLALAQLKDGSNGKEAIARLQSAILKNSPPNPEFYYELAHAYSKSGNPAEAVRWYQEALHRRPVYPAAAKELAVALVAENHTVRAEQVLRLASAASPEDDQLLTDLGNLYLQEGRMDDAQRTLLHALTINPSLPEAENLLGMIAVRRKNSQGAEKWLRSAIRDNPALAEAHNNLASLLSGEGDYKQAAFEYQQALASNPQYAAAHHGYGLMLELMHSYDQAVGELQEAVRDDPEDPEIHSDLADLLAARGQLPEAEEQYLDALGLKPSSADLHASLGSVLVAEGKQDEARAQLEKAIALNADQYQAHLALSMLLFKSGKAAEARVHCRKAAQSPDTDLRSAAFNLLRQIGN